MARPVYKTVGTVSYNGYTFKDPLRTRLTGVPILDAASRATKYVRYTLEVEAFVFALDDYISGGSVVTGSAGISTDPHLEDLRSRLCHVGGYLSVSGIGFGDDIIINPPGTSSFRLDVAFGPHPRILQWTPIGSDETAKILWVCEFTIPECVDGHYQQRNALSEYSFEISWTTSREGITSRTYSGTLEIANSFNSPGGSYWTILDSADRWRDVIIRQIPPVSGFHRDAQFHISRDKRILEFTVTDTEIPSDSPYPAGAVSIDMTHSVSSLATSISGMPGIMNGVKWSNSVQGSITVAPGFPKALAWEAFRSIVADRCRIVNLTNQQTNQSRLQYISGLRIDNSLFNRVIRFEMDFVLVATLDTFMDASGVFKYPATGTWDFWTASLASMGLYNPRSVANLGHDASEDVIVTLCDAPASSPSYIVNKPAVPPSFLFLTLQKPSPKYSWNHFENHYDLLQYDDGIIQHRRYAESNGQDSWFLDPDLDDLSTQTDMDLTAKTPQHTAPVAPDLSQIRSTSTFRFRMYGRCIRTAYDPVIPRVVSVGGVRPIRMGFPSRISFSTITPHPTMPIKEASWDIWYQLPSPPNLRLKHDIIVETDGYYTTERLP